MLAALLVVALVQTAAAPPELATARQWFEAGQHQQVVAVTLNDNSAPALVYLVAQSHDRLTQPAPARAAYERLAGRPETDPWHFIGRSAVLLRDSQPARAVSAAERAVALGPKVAEAHFQANPLHIAGWRPARMPRWYYRDCSDPGVAECQRGSASLAGFVPQPCHAWP